MIIGYCEQVIVITYWQRTGYRIDPLAVIGRTGRYVAKKLNLRILAHETLFARIRNYCQRLLQSVIIDVPVVTVKSPTNIL